MAKKKELRQHKILDILDKKDLMRTTDLAKEVQVTPETIRKDLDEMESQGLVRREHGYVRKIKAMVESPMARRKLKNKALKERIAYRAIEEIKDGQTVFLDSGSTLLSGTDLLRSKKDLTIVTNSIPMVLAVMDLGFKVILLGGVFQKQSQRTEGFFATEMLEAIHIDTAFLGTCGIRGASGFGVYSDAEIETRKKIIQKADRTVAVMDSSKFNEPAAFQFCTFDEIDTLITNLLTEGQRSIVSKIKNIIEV